KGYKCINCGHIDRVATKVKVSIERGLHERLYLPPLRAQRHLTRPHRRQKKRNLGSEIKIIETWHSP
ncbi:MAG: hypothetical protein ACFE7R_02115, partial [Candidatus Hodarchaeota archaeon]